MAGAPEVTNSGSVLLVVAARCEVMLCLTCGSNNRMAWVVVEVASSGAVCQNVRGWTAQLCPCCVVLDSA